MADKKPKYYKLKPRGLKGETWQQIVLAWKNGLSDREAAFRASEDTGQYLTEKDVKEIVANSAEIAALRDYLMNDIVSQAKLNIADNIREGNVSTSKWYLERKAPDEFSSKAAVAFEGAVIGLTMEEKQAEIDKLLESFGVESEERESDGSRKV